jgi:hypothetical protein
MLVGMEIALGVALGLLGVVLAGVAAFVAARRGSRRPRVADTPEPPAAAQDDLPGFLESPPGIGGPPAGPVAGWASLTAPAAPTPPAPRSTDFRAALGAIAAVAVLFVALGVAVATGGGDRRPHAGRPHGSADSGSRAPATTAPGTAGALAERSVPLGDDGIAARLAFEGTVLERHAVGVTATYPQLRLSSDGRRAVAHLELPTFHCLAAEAPGDPVAAGCSRSVAEYADLASPGLRVTRSGDRVRLSGEFATYVRPNGGPAAWTGRSYRIEVTVRAAPGTDPEDWQPAEGVLVLGEDRAGTTGDTDVTAVRRGS